MVSETLGWASDQLESVALDEAGGPGNVLTIEIESETLTEIFTGFGRRGVPAENVAADTVRQVVDYLARDVPVGRHLADQLLVPMAIAGGGRYTTLRPTRHTLTNLEVIKHFVDVACTVDADSHGAWEIELRVDLP